LTFLLDTCVLAELIKPSPDSGLRDWLDQGVPGSHYLSVLVIGEIRQGVARIEGTRKAEELAHWLDRVILPRFDRRVLPVTEAIAARWGEIRGRAMASGRTLPVIDSLIAATALEHHLTLVTRNEADFNGLGLQLVNPWSER